MIDRRDPVRLGEKLLSLLSFERLEVRGGDRGRMLDTDERGVPVPSASAIADKRAGELARTRDYRDESTIEKYGDPRLLPSTMP